MFNINKQMKNIIHYLLCVVIYKICKPVNLAISFMSKSEFWSAKDFVSETFPTYNPDIASVRLSVECSTPDVKLSLFQHFLAKYNYQQSPRKVCWIAKIQIYSLYTDWLTKSLHIPCVVAVATHGLCTAFHLPVCTTVWEGTDVGLDIFMEDKGVQWF